MDKFFKGDEVEIRGFPPLNGKRFIAESVIPHSEGSSCLVFLDDDTAEEWRREFPDQADLLISPDDDKVAFWSGFLKNLGPVTLEND